jgi:cell division septum initiation protein DivIVA
LFLQEQIKGIIIITADTRETAQAEAKSITTEARAEAQRITAAAQDAAQASVM